MRIGVEIGITITIITAIIGLDLGTINNVGLARIMGEEGVLFSQGSVGMVMGCRLEAPLMQSYSIKQYRQSWPR
jgi:hypothetical protein